MSDLRGATVLLAEDDQGLLDAATFVLEDEGCAVMTAHDGEQALAMLRENAPSESIDLLVTDIQMPKMNGLALIRGVREIAPDLPVVVITGFGDRDTLKELIRLGCNEFLDKPFAPEDLIEKVREVLGVLQAKRTEAAQEKSALMAELETYRSRFDSLRKEVDAAVAIYRDLADLPERTYAAPTAFRIKALKDLGGDWAAVCNTPWGVDAVVADVAGHDLAASYHTMLFKAFFDENCRAGHDGEAFFNLVNHALLERETRDRGVTAIFLRLDVGRRLVQVVSAAHPACILVPADGGAPRRLDLSGHVLGLIEEVEFGQLTLDVAPGDKLLLFSDGLPYAFRVDGPTGVTERLGMDGLETIMARHRGLPLEELVDAVFEEVMDFSRRKQTDDMLLLGVQAP